MEILNKKDFISATNLSKFRLGLLAGFLMRITHLKKMNKAYHRAYSENGLEFIEKAFQEFGITYEVDAKELENIPKEGAFITVSNHPFGGIDGLMLIKTLAEKRSDFKVMANFLLEKIDPIKDYLLSVNPFEELKGRKSSFQGIKNAIQHLEKGSPVGIFPAGEVSTYHKESKVSLDRQWQNSVIRIILQAKVPVIPVYFTGTNSKIFHLLGKINPLLRTARLATELFNKKKQTLRMRVGKPIAFKDLEEFDSADQVGRFLRAKTYSLGSTLQVKKSLFKRPIKLKKPKQIVDAIPKEVLKNEVEGVSSDYLVQNQGKFSLYIAPHTSIPNLLLEIGRLREITFRETGEGTNKKIDLDEYDLYYHHLFIWDNDNDRLVGGYRMAKGKEIMDIYGVNGFYINTLFKITEEFHPYLEKSIELGRSFIIKEYQKTPIPLLLLWRGIWYYLLSHPEYKYLTGPVSISNEISNFSKSLLIEYIKSNFFDRELSQYIKPRKRFKPDFGVVDANLILEKAHNNINYFDKYIEEIETSKMKIPVLLKKYLKQNAKILGFNIDPKFNNSLDGLIFLALNDIPQAMVDRLNKDLQLN